MATNNNGLTQHRNCAGFTLIEVLVAVLIFSVGILSMAAFSALNYMYLRSNQVNAKVHILTESTMENVQEWAMEATLPGPTRFYDIWNGGHNIGDILTTYTSGPNITANVVYDGLVGVTPTEGGAQILLRIIATGTSGDRTYTETTDFCLTNYSIGE